jgi:hypothetical protein
MIKKLFLLTLVFSQVVYAQKTVSPLSWPAVTKESKPWARWWLPGSIVSQRDMTAALKKYSAAGIGGLELTVLYGVKGQESKFINYLSPDWMKMFVSTLSEAKKFNLGMDLANASSWPFGGPWVDEQDASKYVAYKTFELKEGESLKEKVIYIQKPYVKWNGPYRTDIKNITDPVNNNKNLQELAIDQIKFEKPIPLQVLMAYSDRGQITDLTGKVDDSGNLNWTPPAGNWTLYAVFQGLHGKMVERAGPGGEGLVIDHFSETPINNFLRHFDEAFKGYDISYLRGYFNDSYEVDDASGQSCWTFDFFNQFQQRRGYDLKENLPALFQKDDPEKNARVLCDYRQTISDLILDAFTKKWTSWANKQGKITRNQAHGSPGNILDLYAASDIPETEGTEILRMKFGTSAANVTGKKIASAEACTWLGEHFSSTLGDVKKAVDQYYIAGVNQIYYHGICFSPENEAWPGFQFYAAVEFSPANPFWNDFQGLNTYVTRVQSFLQSSEPDNDILLYFPIFDRFSDYNNQMLEHFDAISPRFNGTPFRISAQTMLDRGFSYDYISDNQIYNSQVSDSKIRTEGGALYNTLVLPGSKYIPVETFSKILDLAEKGATIIIPGNIPDDIAGWSQLKSKKETFQLLKDKLNFAETTDNEIKLAVKGSGRILLGNDIEKLLLYAKIRKEKMIENGLRFTRRTDKNFTSYFILNQSDKSWEGWIPLQVKATGASLFNSMTGTKGLAKSRLTTSGNIEVYANLSPFETAIVRTFSLKVTGDKYQYYDTLSPPREIKGVWNVDFIEGGPQFPSSKVITKLVPWNEFEGTTYKDFSGTVRYTMIFSRPATKPDVWLIDLGKVCESAHVFLNNKDIAVLIGPEYKFVIDNRLLQPENYIEIRVSNLAANRIAYLDRNNLPWKKFYNTNFPARLKENSKNGLFDASAWSPRKSGLIGPVTVTPLKKR